MDKIIKHCNKNMGGSSEKVKMELGTQKWENEANDSK
jgi:hypothetical protein